LSEDFIAINNNTKRIARDLYAKRMEEKESEIAERQRESVCETECWRKRE
jgi:hypothetical protein